MTGSFLDVDAPNTAWRGSSEDPIPVILGRASATAFAYRFLTGRPLDGHARTDATFLHAGTKAFTKSGRTAPYNYWPGWKRGLLMTRLPAFGLVPWTAAVGINEQMDIGGGFWWHWGGPTVGWSPLVALGAISSYRYGRDFQHERRYVRPLRQAAVATLRTRDSVKLDIPRGLVHGRVESAVGKLFLPPTHALPEGDRENLLTACRERLGHEALDARWNMEGARPHMELFTPPQPPGQISWDTMVSHADTVSPYLGHAAHGPMSWDLGDDSPHAGVVGGSGSGKSELVAWIVSQFMRGGAGVVVLDPKYASHRWLMGVPGVLYCTEAAMLHDTILWLDSELRRRGLASQSSTEEFPRLVVLLEERNSLQTMLREHWEHVRPTGWRGKSPALGALDRLNSQGRSLNINVLIAAQETAQVHIGSRTSIGAFAVAGRMPVGNWKMVMGAGTKKPAISSKPGRFGWIVGGQATVFQAAYPDLKRHAARLLEFALGGEPILNVQQMMMQQETVSFPSSGAASSEGETVELVTLRQFSEAFGVPLTKLNNMKQRDSLGFPKDQGTGEKGAKHYRLMDLLAYCGVEIDEDEEGDEDA